MDLASGCRHAMSHWIMHWLQSEYEDENKNWSYAADKNNHSGILSAASLYCARYFAVGSADSLVSLWDITEMLCVRTFTKLEWVSPGTSQVSYFHCKKFLNNQCMFSSLNPEVGNDFSSSIILRWPVRTISFNHTGEFIASASEDLFIDIVSNTKHLCINFSSLYCLHSWAK